MHIVYSDQAQKQMKKLSPGQRKKVRKSLKRLGDLSQPERALRAHFMRVGAYPDCWSIWAGKHMRIYYDRDTLGCVTVQGIEKIQNMKKVGYT